MSRAVKNFLEDNHQSGLSVGNIIEEAYSLKEFAKGEAKRLFLASNFSKTVVNVYSTKASKKYYYRLLILLARRSK